MENINLGKLLPAVTLEDASKALPVARAIKEGGINVMEVTFRSEVAGESIAMIRNGLPDMLVGAGTILTIAQLLQAKSAGAQFALSPGFNPVIVKKAKEIDLPFIPGVMTPSEIEWSLEAGCKVLKLFPVSQIGGLAMLKALQGPFGHTGVSFIPMGGVNLQNMYAYLRLSNVRTVGGSWLATGQLIDGNKFETIKKNTMEALASIAKGV